MKRSRAILAVGAVFVAGLLAGALLVQLVEIRRLGGRPRGFFDHALGTRALERFDLAPEQRREVDRILSQSREEAERLRRDLRPKFEQILERSSAEIEAVLSPEQRIVYRDTLRRQRERFERHERRRGGPPRPP